LTADFFNLASGLLLQKFIKSDRARAPRRTAYAAAQFGQVKVQFIDGAAESIAVHAEFASRSALVAMVAFQYVQDEPLLKFAYRFRVQNATFVHLGNESFQLILHSASLSLWLIRTNVFVPQLQTAQAHSLFPY
jgi:hypothetical protein